MQRSLSRGVIIGVVAAALAALSGCSALRLGYAQGPQLVHWWLDGYVDLDEHQRDDAREKIRDWFAWHRATQLPDYAALLARAQVRLDGPVEPGQVCRLMDEVRERLAAGFDGAVPAAVAFARTLAPQQLAQIERRQEKNNIRYRGEYLQEDLQERHREAVRRIVDRAESLYGRLDAAQREHIGQWVADSPFDPQGWLEERQRRQQALLALLHRLVTEAVPQEEAHAALRQVFADAWRSPREAYRAYQERLAAYNCRFAAQVHNQATPDQRRRALARLQGWEDDLRALSNGS
jgi:hypothetical protein